MNADIPACHRTSMSTGTMYWTVWAPDPCRPVPIRAVVGVGVARSYSYPRTEGRGHHVLDMGRAVGTVTSYLPYPAQPPIGPLLRLLLRLRLWLRWAGLPSPAQSYSYTYRPAPTPTPTPVLYRGRSRAARHGHHATISTHSTYNNLQNSPCALGLGIVQSR